MTAESIISMLKEISDNGNKKYPVTDFGGVFIFRITFFDKIPNDVANKLIDLNLPDEVIELLSCTNGLNLFEDEFQGMELGGPVCKIYSGQEILNRYQESIDKDLIPKMYFSKMVRDVYCSERQCFLGMELLINSLRVY